MQIHSFPTIQPPAPALLHISAPSLLVVPCQAGTSGTRGSGKLGLHKDLLHPIFLFLEFVVDLVQLVHAHPVGDHLQRIDLAAFDHAAELLPIHVNWSLTVANQPDPAFHE